jgi:thioredoxin-like negative regulator of GroEL
MFSSGSKVRLLDRNDFFRGVPKKRDAPVLVLFYAPWCPHCKSMKTDWERLAETTSSFSVAAIDVDKFEEVAAQAKVESFPTVRLYHQERMYEYSGHGRTAEDFTKFAQDHLDYFVDSPVVEEFRDIGRIRKFVTDNQKPVAVMMYAPWCKYCKAMKATWTKVAHAIGSNALVGAMNCDRMRGIVDSFPTIVLFTVDGDVHRFEDSVRSQENITAFLCRRLGGCSRR